LVQCVPDGSDEIDCPTKSTNKSSKDQNMKYVLVTGYPTNDETAQMEVMDESGSTKICKNQKSKYPLQVSLATGVYTEGRMIVCGGSSPPKSVKSACYSYEDDQQGWTKLADMDTQRSGSSSIQIPGGILVTGGYGGGKRLKTSEIIYYNGTVKQGRSLPKPRNGHCMVEYQDQIISTGGVDEYGATTSDVWSFNNHVEFTLTNKPSMKHTRINHACGIVHSIQHQGRPILVAAGSNLGDGQDKSEYLDFTLPGSQWQLCSENLPVQMWRPRMITTKNENQLLMIHNEGIYSFNCRSSNDCYWEKKTSELQICRRDHVMMKVPASMVENC